MDQLKKNKELILEYFNAISGVVKTPAIMNRYVDDHELLEHVTFFDTVLPRYELFADEITAEGNRVVVRARLKATHEGAFKGIPPTHKKVEFAFAIGYEIENNKIVRHWLIADQMTFMEQIGIEVIEGTTV
jgi:hypothetical protein